MNITIQEYNKYRYIYIRNMCWDSLFIRVYLREYLKVDSRRRRGRPRKRRCYDKLENKCTYPSHP